MNSIQTTIHTMLDHQPLLSEELYLHLPTINLNIRSNSQMLLDQLRHYFRHITSRKSDNAVEIIAIERLPLQLDLPWKDWAREPGKVGRKDAYVDGDGFRLIRKVRTGMLFLQSSNQCIATGPCEKNCNQVINFIINQQMTALQQSEWMICHTSAVVRNGNALALAGFSGGGKSTLMLHLMDSPEWKFVTNDRLFIKAELLEIKVEGVPKLPRVNPGTLLHNPKLRTILSPQRIADLETMSINELWDLEEKYDVDVLDRYGEQRIQHQAKLAHVMVLNWSHTSDQPTRISRVNLEQRPQLLQAIMKSPGPFYQHPDGSFQQDDTPLPQDSYHKLLAGVDLLEVQGKVDFNHLRNFCNTVLTH